ncbi:LOW QUALITY PROTEIN: hypothetical protein RJ641_017158, partial [Dillenia turbinata]
QCPRGDWKCYIKYKEDQMAVGSQVVKNEASLPTTLEAVFTPYVRYFKLMMMHLIITVTLLGRIGFPLGKNT